MSTPRTYAAEGVIDLPPALLFGPEFLGLRKRACIGGIDVTLVFPDFEAKGHGFEPILPRQARIDWVGSLKTLPDEDDPGHPFGRVTAHDGPKEIIEFSPARLLLRPRSHLTLAEARRLHAATDDWTDQLQTWIEVITRQDLREEKVKVEHVGAGAWVWVDKGKEGKIFRGRREITLSFGEKLQVTASQWGKILAKVSQDIFPPEAHIFLRDARYADNLGRRRRSVLDSATAAELGLAKLRDDLLRGTDGRVAAYVGREARQIGGLIEFLKAMGRELPGKIQQEVGEPRNRAIHEGREPDAETARAALAKAEEIVDVAFPLGSLL